MKISCHGLSGGLVDLMGSGLALRPTQAGRDDRQVSPLPPNYSFAVAKLSLAIWPWF